MKVFSLAILLALTGCVDGALKPISPPSSGGHSGNSSLQSLGSTGGIVGRVLGIDGKPAIRIDVQYQAANHLPSQVAQLVGNNAAALVSNNAGGLTIGTPLLAGTPYRILASLFRTQSGSGPAVVQTNDNGEFVIVPTAAGPLNLAAQSADPSYQAWKGSVNFAAGSVTQAGDMQLAPTGQISGSVLADNVTDYAGTRVYIPGSSYGADVDKSGNYLIDHVPANPDGFMLLAYSPELGEAGIPNQITKRKVVVSSGQTTQADSLLLKITPPQILAITQPAQDRSVASANRGDTIDIHGQDFGYAKGLKIQIFFSGAVPINGKALRMSDGLIRVPVPSDATVGSDSVTVEVGNVTATAVPLTVGAGSGTTGPVSSPTPGTSPGPGYSPAPAVSPAPSTTPGGTFTPAPGGGNGKGYGVGDFLDQNAVVNTITIGFKVTPVPVPAALVSALAVGPAGFNGGSPLYFNRNDGFVHALDLVAQVLDWDTSWMGSLQLVGLNSKITGLAQGGGMLYIANSDNVIQQIDLSTGKEGKIAGNGTGLVDGPAIAPVTQAAKFNSPSGLAVTPDGALFIADTGNRCIRRIKDGQVTTYANSANFVSPVGLAYDPTSGNLYVSDSGANANRILVVSPDPHGGTNVRNLAGNGTAGFQDGIGDGASFNHPTGVAVDWGGNVIVADTGNQVIRAIGAQTRQVKTVAGTPGTIGGTAYPQKGIPCQFAQFYNPTAVAVDVAGHVIYVGDTGNSTLRNVFPSQSHLWGAF